ncbi:hypothetical protein ACFFX0_28625 [Citricoccus parietis]|uniref:Uncharacterized protein n=1 Tax=Citricoccus parietis TaxID=592307 RepID=A0ABV5G7K2_9MICC
MSRDARQSDAPHGASPRAGPRSLRTRSSPAGCTSKQPRTPRPLVPTQQPRTPEWRGTRHPKRPNRRTVSQVGRSQINYQRVTAEAGGWARREPALPMPSTVEEPDPGGQHDNDESAGRRRRGGNRLLRCRTGP